MKKLLFTGVCFLYFVAGAQNTDFRVIEYKPAPGQHINQELLGTPEAAQLMAEEPDRLVSLGGFGGYVIIGLSKPVENDPLNPYGIDFTVFGNAFSGSSEPGVICVSTDVNRNGEPDDEWYEIAGSRHFHSKTIKNYSLTYFPSGNRNVTWSDNLGNSGIIEANSFHLQEYYPEAGIFPGYPQDSVMFRGTRIFAGVDNGNPAEVRIDTPVFGYADLRSKKQGVALNIPDNPYTSQVEGAGGDPVDISWAVDQQGNYVSLDSIHFIKIVSACFQDLGQIGEISTDVAWIEDVTPGEIPSAKESCIEIYPLPKKLISGDSLMVEACYFEQGRKKDSLFTFYTSNESVLSMGDHGKFYARDPGSATIRVLAGGDESSVAVRVVFPDSIKVNTDFASVYPGDTVLISSQVYDNENGLTALDAFPENITVSLGKILFSGGKYYFVAEQPGPVILTFRITGFDITKIITFNILSEQDRLPVFFTMKTETKNLFPWQEIGVEMAELNNHVENRVNDYQGIKRHTLFHALVAGMKKAEVNFGFRDDQSASGHLYLFRVEKDEEFTYGWGGKVSPEAYARGWIARLNGKSYISGFDSIAIHAGDTLILYHESDLTTPWILTRMVASRDSAVEGEKVTIVVEQTECELIQGLIYEKNFTLVSGRQIQAKETWFTDHEGKAEIIFEGTEPLRISSGNDAVIIIPRIATGISDQNLTRTRVFPNPATEMIWISGITDIREIELTDREGRILRTTVPLRYGEQRLDLHNLPAGIYFLRIRNENGHHVHKVIKK